MRVHFGLAIACTLLGAGCKPSEPRAPAEGPAGLREKSMHNCPSAVVGATTSIRETADGVTLDVTSDDPAATREILARAEKHAAMGPPTGIQPLHNGLHGGPGDTGHCPVIHLGTTVTAEQIFRGARITIVANDPSTVAQLHRDTRDRLAWFDAAHPH
ncbi:MAG TPA: hypothetical protein VHE35_01220 [Kofleriaceae bacterium]|nr:hypothetical protein [Kofleriaceae bacterium]